MQQGKKPLGRKGSIYIGHRRTKLNCMLAKFLVSLFANTSISKQKAKLVYLEKKVLLNEAIFSLSSEKKIK